MKAWQFNSNEIINYQTPEETAIMRTTVVRKLTAEEAADLEKSENDLLILESDHGGHVAGNIMLSNPEFNSTLAEIEYAGVDMVATEVSNEETMT